MSVTPRASPCARRTPISFAAGGYSFGNVGLDAPGVVVAGGSGTVSVAANTVQVQNSSADTGGCTAGGALACGAGQFALNTTSLTFGDGVFRIYGAGQGVTLSAPGGVFVQGEGRAGRGGGSPALANSLRRRPSLSHD